jgi:lysophospholipase L1-like esterase
MTSKGVMLCERPSSISKASKVGLSSTSSNSKTSGGCTALVIHSGSTSLSTSSNVSSKKPFTVSRVARPLFCRRKCTWFRSEMKSAEEVARLRRVTAAVRKHKKWLAQYSREQQQKRQDDKMTRSNGSRASRRIQRTASQATSIAESVSAKASSDSVTVAAGANLQSGSGHGRSRQQQQQQQQQQQRQQRQRRRRRRQSATPKPAWAMTAQENEKNDEEEVEELLDWVSTIADDSLPSADDICVEAVEEFERKEQDQRDQELELEAAYHKEVMLQQLLEMRRKTGEDDSSTSDSGPAGNLVHHDANAIKLDAADHGIAVSATSKLTSNDTVTAKYTAASGTGTPRTGPSSLSNRPEWNACAKQDLSTAVAKQLLSSRTVTDGSETPSLYKHSVASLAVVVGKLASASKSQNHAAVQALPHPHISIIQETVPTTERPQEPDRMPFLYRNPGV